VDFGGGFPLLIWVGLLYIVFETEMDKGLVQMTFKNKIKTVVHRKKKSDGIEVSFYPDTQIWCFTFSCSLFFVSEEFKEREAGK